MYQLVKLGYPLKSDRWKVKGNKRIMLTKDIGIFDVPKDEKLEEYDYIEENFTIKLKGDRVCLPRLLDDRLGIYIGAAECVGDKIKRVDVEELDTDIIQQEDSWVTLQAKENSLCATLYLYCMITVMRRGRELGRQLVIYTDYMVEPKNYEIRSLLWRVINELAEKEKVIVVHRLYGDMRVYYTPTVKPFEPYIENGIYTKDPPDRVVRKLNRIGICGHKSLKKVYRRQIDTLYDDVFYNKIPEDEYIYVPTTTTSTVPQERYEELGLSYIRIQRDYGILYGMKSTFDKVAAELYSSVLTRFVPMMLTYQPLMEIHEKDVEIQPLQMGINGGSEGVCIAFIGTDGIDYRKPWFIGEDGQSRIEYVWEQQEGGIGKTYTKEDIEQAIKQQELLSILPLEEEQTSTVLFEIAATGKINESREEVLANKATFAFIKLKGTSKNLQQLYAGDYHKNTVMLEDIVIALNKLLAFKDTHRNPIVIGVPYATNLNSHDGASILESIIGNLAHERGVTILTQTGDEGDKGHHARVVLEDDNPQSIIMDINEEQSVIGMVWLDIPNSVSATLYNISSPEGYDLTFSHEIKNSDIEMYTTGFRVSYHNGSRYNLFKIKTHARGEWRIEFVRESDLHKSTVDIWVGMEQHNKYATLRPAEVCCTVPSLSNAQSLITVGAYDSQTFTVNSSSGRGYTRNNLVSPTFIMRAEQYEGCMQNRLCGVVCMAQINAIIANIYGVWLKTIGKELANTSYMRNMLSTYLMQLDTSEYPNRSQGYGIFTIESFKELMLKEFDIEI